LGEYDLVLADPPYTSADAAEYGTPMVVPGRVMKALAGLPVGARVVWLDERVPTYSRDAWVHEGIIGLSTSAGHRFRVISIFRREAPWLAAAPRTSQPSPPRLLLTEGGGTLPE
jgi:hypothetical protein